MFKNTFQIGIISIFFSVGCVVSLITSAWLTLLIQVGSFAALGKKMFVVHGIIII